MFGLGNLEADSRCDVGQLRISDKFHRRGPCIWKRSDSIVRDMSDAPDERLLEPLLDSWDRNNTILLNLLHALPEGGLEARAMEGSPSIAQLFTHSAQAVRDAVKSRLETGRDMDLHYDHPILLLQHMLWHEGYHHGQMKLALKVAGRPITDEEVGPVTWGVWMRKK
jgi:uncharacterized damage-inducible protein DinB